MSQYPANRHLHQMRDGLSPPGLNGSRHIAKSAPGLFDRERRCPSCDPDAFHRSRGGAMRHMVGDELNHPSGQLRERAGNWNEQLPAAAGRHQRENLFQRDTVAAENVAMPDTSLFHRKNEADRDIAYVDEVHVKIKIHLKYC